jgi:hypothetical protein
MLFTSTATFGSTAMSLASTFGTPFLRTVPPRSIRRHICRCVPTPYSRWPSSIRLITKLFHEKTSTKDT